MNYGSFKRILGLSIIFSVLLQFVVNRDELFFSSILSARTDLENDTIQHPIQQEQNVSNSTQEQEFTFRDTAEYSTEKVGAAYKETIYHSLDQSKCIDFACIKTEAECGGHKALEPTNYDGELPPCCSHILRDMAKIFDDTMQDLRLDYSAGFGTLLGLIRSEDRTFIPWTADNDYIIPSFEVMNAIVSLWNETQTGMQHIFQGINRICITSDWADGKLNRWKIPTPTSTTHGRWYLSLWARGYPYIDLYVGKMIAPNIFQEIRPCRHLYDDLFPTNRVEIYNGTFFNRIPANPEQFLRTYYGRDWRVPKKEKNAHGSGDCPHNEVYK